MCGLLEGGASAFLWLSRYRISSRSWNNSGVISPGTLVHYLHEVTCTQHVNDKGSKLGF